MNGGGVGSMYEGTAKKMLDVSGLLKKRSVARGTHSYLVATVVLVLSQALVVLDLSDGLVVGSLAGRVQRVRI